MGNLTDRRIEKTRQAIYGALVELIQEKDLSRITIKELVERANINRKTFYNHYNDVYEVLDDLENKLIDNFVQQLLGMGLEKLINEPVLLIHEGIHEMQENEQIHILMIHAKDRSRFISKLVKEEKALLRELWRGDFAGNEEWTDYFMNFFVSGTMAVFETWFQAENRPPIENVSEFFDAMSSMLLIFLQQSS